MASCDPSFTLGEGLLDPDSATPRFDHTSLHRFSLLNLFNVEGVVAVITGGGSGKRIHLKAVYLRIEKNADRRNILMTGIGLIMASALESNGATVYIVGRRGDVLRKAAAENSVCPRALGYLYPNLFFRLRDSEKLFL